MSDQVIQVKDTDSGKIYPIRIRDNGDGSYSQDSSSSAEGKVSDAAIITNIAGTTQGKLRGIVAILAAVWNNSANYLFTSLKTGLLNTLDSITVYKATDKIMVTDSSGNLIALTPKRLPVDVSASGATTVVPLSPGKKIRVLNIVLVVSDFVNINFQSHITTSNFGSGVMHLGSNGGIAPPESTFGHFETVAGEALDINLSNAIQVGGWIVYIEIP